jgi:hypothetical protein
MRDAKGEIFAVAILEPPHLIEMLQILIKASHQILDNEMQKRTGNRQRCSERGERPMGFAMAYGICVCCGQTFGFNPVRVPSCRINGNREPICGICIPQINIRRRAKGLAEIIPLPDAYQACEESELLIL